MISRRHRLATLALPFALLAAFAPLACGETTQSREDSSGNTNWLKPCNADAECGELSCACGLCRDACAGTTDCSAEPAQSCVAPLASNAPPPPAPSTRAEHRDTEALALDFAVAADGSVALTGGTEPRTFDFSLTYPVFWVTLLSPQGEAFGAWRNSQAADQITTGRSVTFAPDNTILTLGTTYDGADTPFLRWFIQVEQRSGWVATPGFTHIRADGAGGFLTTGSNRLNELGAPRPFMTAWMGRFEESFIEQGTLGVTPVPVWEQQRQGVDGSISNILTSIANADGELLVGGSLGTDPDSNASEPYLARLDIDGNFLWEHSVPLSEVTHCDTTAVAFTADGGSLAAIGCGSRWLRHYSAAGDLAWERRFAGGVTALAGLADGGYAVALGGGKATLQRYDVDHQLLWETSEPGCGAFTRLEETNGAVLALAQCERGYVLKWFETD